MKRTPMVIVAVGLILMLGLGAYAQVRKDQKTGMDRIEGTIQSIDKEKSTLTLMQTSSKAPWKVVYNDQTKFTHRNQPAKIDELKDGLRVIVLGKYENNTMTASRIDVRTEK